MPLLKKPLLLKKRETQSKELMDDPLCDKTLLFNTYRHFKKINRFFSGWHFIYKRWIRPYAIIHGSCSVLDVGCGGGDVMLMLSEWAKKDKIKLHLHGIDPDPHAYAYLQTQKFPKNITFEQSTLKALVKASTRYDFVISNHLVHHLAADECIGLLENAKKISNRAVIFNDIHRSDLAYLGFTLLAALFYRNSFAFYDGRLSIRRSYTLNELGKTLGNILTDFQLISCWPSRLLVLLDHGVEHSSQSGSKSAPMV